jgi:hypothetical protein
MRCCTSLNRYLASNSGVPSDDMANMFPFTNVEAAGQVDNSATTNFVADKNVVHGEIAKYHTLDSILLRSSVTQSEESVKSFLMKPRQLYSGFFTTTDTVSSFTPFQIPNDILNLNIYKNKVSGYYGIRATTVFTLVINATRFQQGRYMMCFTPTAGASPVQFAQWVNAHKSSLFQRTQLPHVELDLNCDTQAVLKVPFVSGFNYFPIQQALTTAFCNGQLQMFPYSGLVVGSGSNIVNFTLYVNFEDIELMGPAAPEMGNMTEVEQKSMKIGPIASAAANVTGALDLLSRVPLLSHIATPASWVTDAIRRSALVFGWSKPLNLENAHRVQRVPIPYSGNVDAPDQALPISLTVKNQVEVFPGFSGTDIDEMDFGHFASIPSYYTQFPWNGGLNNNASLFNIPVNPNLYFQQRTGTNINVNDYTPVAYVAHMFNNWRGSLVFRFKFVKTEFHSGRLAICFYPLYPGQTAPVTFVGSDYVQREIIDIREVNEVTLTVPYFAIQPWLPSNVPTGQIQAWVIDELVAPATVTQNITILVEVCGGPDFEVAVPNVNIANTPTYDITVQAGEMPEIEIQAGPRNDCETTNTCIGTSQINFDNYSNAAAAVGERISSFRTLLKSASWVTYGLGGATIPSPTGIYNAIATIPFSIPVWDSTAAAAGNNSFQSDLYASIASCFALSRGGVRIRYLLGGLRNGTVNATPITANFSSATSYVQALQGTSNDWMVPFTQTGFAPQSIPCMVAHNVADDKCIEIQVPQYHVQHSRINAFHAIGPNFPYAIGTASPETNIILLTYTRDQFASALGARSGADDLNMGMFISIPPMAQVTQVTALNQY